MSSYLATSRAAVLGDRLSGTLWSRLRRLSNVGILAGCTAMVVLSYAVATWALARVVAHAAGEQRVQDAVIGWSHDPVYGRLALALVGNVQARGLGDFLSVVFTSGSAVVGVHLVRLLVDVGLLMGGCAWLRVLAHRGRSAWLRTLAVLWIAYGAGATLRLTWANGGGGEMVLSMLATKALGLGAQQYDAISSHGQALSWTVDIGLIAVAAGAGALIGELIGRISGHKPQQQARWRSLRGRRRVLAAAALVVLCGAAWKPAVAFERPSSAGPRLNTKAAGAAATSSNLPSVVTITATGAGWEYLVNGRPTIVKGIGYNAVTTGESPQERTARYDRDFSSIRATGANTIAGWTEGEFDDLLMRKSAEHGLGVILPFHLGPTYVLSEPDYAYEDPQVRQMLLDAVSRRVEHFRNSPALRMWGLGNEVLHAISWAHGSPAHAQAFADFLVVAADRVHQLDPNHPVVYRDAEDWYVKPVVQALAAHPKSRPWFVYGMNFFTTRLQSALDKGPVNELDQPLFVSEFGPVGLRPEARPAGYEELWNIVESHGARVLGGSAYVWTTAGPEPLDRNFGLTDANGQPVDGSLAELAAIYRGG